jgi:putative ABC transport system substrate-binding protein
MRRRAFILTLGCAAAALPLAALAQQGRVRRIGWLSPGSGPSDATRSFIQSAREQGYVEGENLLVEYRWAAGNSARLADLAEELVRASVDVIVTVGSPATLAAKRATSSIPIVFAAAGAPIQKGIVASLANPGGNVTGLALITDDIKALEILKEAAPAISRAAFLYDPDTLPGAFGEDWLKRARARARRLKVELGLVAFRDPSRIDQVFAALPAGTNALLLENSATNALARRRICALAAQRGIPTASVERTFADAGCLMSYGEDQLDMHRRAAGYVSKVLKGARPAELPVEQPTRFRLVVNLKTAGQLGLEMAPTFIARADEVIE